jgi:hypothetical protein
MKRALGRLEAWLVAWLELGLTGGFLVWLFSGPCLAWQSEAPEKPDDSPRFERALELGTSSSWYNRDKKDIAEIELRTPDPLDNRHRMIAKPAAPSNVNWNWSFSGLWAALWYITLGICAIGLLALLIWALQYSESMRTFLRRRQDGVTHREHAVAKITDLPFQLDAATGDLLAEVKRFVAAKDYSQATIYAYSHCLMELDRGRQIRLQKGKTNRMYLRELGRRVGLRNLMHSWVWIFEKAFFGRYVISQSEFETCWNQMPEFHALLEQAKAQDEAREAAEADLVAPSLTPGNATPNSLAARANLVAWWWIVGLGLSLGCGGRTGPTSAEYGVSSGPQAKQSISGLSVLRSYCDLGDFKTVRLGGLAKRASKVDVIIWAPDDYRVPSKEALDWFEAWLANRPNRRLVFLGRDAEPGLRYWNRQMELRGNEPDLKWRSRLALEESHLADQQHLGPTREYGRWFVFDNHRPPTTLVRLQGPWVDQSAADGPTPSVATQIQVGQRIVPIDQYDPVDLDALEKQHPVPKNPTLPRAMRNFGSDTRPRWSDDKDGSDAYSIQTLLEDQAGEAFAFQVSHPDWRHQDANPSRIIVVGSSLPFLNLGLIDPVHQRMAARLVAQFPSGGRIGFLESDSSPRISETDEEFAGVKGFEMLTVWPINLVTLHAALVGIVVLAALFPIFGRPRQIPARSTQDFGQHVDALGDLLYLTRDRTFAFQTIAEYFRNVRNEPTHPWAMPHVSPAARVVIPPTDANSRTLSSTPDSPTSKEPAS